MIPVQCPICGSKGWCMNSAGVRMRRTHRARVQLWHRIIWLLRRGLVDEVLE